MHKTVYPFFTLLVIILLVTACAPTSPTETPTKAPATQEPSNDSSAGQEILPTATFTPTPKPPQEFLPPVSYGPNQEDFPEGVNPLTGLPVTQPELLKQPALVVSIPHFPKEVRPQGGLSFAPWVFEYLISAGSTRLAAVFHGGTPYPEAPLTGDCEVRAEPFVQDGILLGNRVWQDKNGDGVQSPDEPGVGGVCVNLYDANGELLQGTSSDSNGYYGFNVDAGTYNIEFVQPEGWTFTESDIGYENTDSDAGQDSGRTGAFQVDEDTRHVDAGLLPLNEPDPAEVPPAEIGPVRSGRLIHVHLQKSLQNSCLIYAGATYQIRGLIPSCAQVFKEGDGGIGAMLEIERMKAISEDNGRREGSDFNYANNLFTDEVTTGGLPATQVDMFFSQFNQSKWVYDPTYQAWLRYVDNVSEETEFHPDTDRLNGRQVFFENVIVLFVEHELIEPLIIDMYLGQGEEGRGFAFRDGQMYNIKWNTRSSDYEKTTGFRRPIAFTDEDGDPFPLRPGHSWIVVATPYSDYFQNQPGKWTFRIYSPPGAGVY